MLTALFVTAVLSLTAGYGLRCWRPCRRAFAWAERVVRRCGPDYRRRPAWWAAQGVFAASIAVAAVADPAHVYRLLRHGPPAPPPRSPAIRVTSREEVQR